MVGQHSKPPPLPFLDYRGSSLHPEIMGTRTSTACLVRPILLCVPRWFKDAVGPSHRKISIVPNPEHLPLDHAQPGSHARALWHLSPQGWSYLSGDLIKESLALLG